MSEPDWQNQALIAPLYRLLAQAGERILAVYRDSGRWQTDLKADDSPVTAADLAASAALVTGLPGIVDRPVLSEEALVSYERRRHWRQYWLVDPMDGTREFLHRSGEFVINVAFMEANEPVFGMLYQPVTGEAWWGGATLGARCGRPDRSVPLRPQPALKRVRALGSRRSSWRGAWRGRLERAGYQVETATVGSALKFMHLASGEAHLYPRLGLTSEWDTAAPQAILRAAGGELVQWNGLPLEYGKEDTLNPEFVAVSDPALLAVLIPGYPGARG